MRISTPRLALSPAAAVLAVVAACAGCSTLFPTRPAGVSVETPASKSEIIPLPNREGSLKFGVLGDFGTGDRAQYQLAEQMAKLHERFPYELVILVGDNMYGGERAEDFRSKFEVPYKPLLERGVKFYASLGNHDARNQRFYELFNMGGKLYYSFKAPKQNVRFYALETTYAEPDQMAWVEKELEGANDDWKIPFFHHPLYSSGARHGSDIRLRTILEPLFVEHQVKVVFTGHDHFYERTKLQKGIAYFVVGSGGKLRGGNIDRTTGLTASGFDTDVAFLAAEIFENELTFNVVSRTGQIVDSGVITRQPSSR
jgi:hypothetical protein